MLKRIFGRGGEGKIGLALGGGGARGWSHIGVLRVLEENNVPVCCVAGTSIGALVGAAYASGSLDSLEKLAREMGLRDVFNYFFDLPGASGLVRGRRVTRLLMDHIQAQQIEDMRIPFAAVSADLVSGQETVLDHGDPIEAIRASIAVPGIFTPVAHNGKMLVDGGIVNPVPVDVARKLGAHHVIAVEVNPVRLSDRFAGAAAGQNPLDLMNTDGFREAGMGDKIAMLAGEFRRGRETKIGMLDVLGRASQIMQTQIAQVRLQEMAPAVLIRPKVSEIEFMKFNEAAKAIEAGRRAAESALPEIRKLL